jgi:hypothetical protein
MTRGPRPLAAIRDAKKFAERMGYSAQDNTDHPDLGYDFIAFRDTYVILVRIRVVRNTINPDIFYEDLLADELRDIRSLPFPKWFPREIWLRTQHERTFRRLRIHDLSVGEIGFWTPDEYVNPHAK